jgi:hypothetical protein
MAVNVRIRGNRTFRARPRAGPRAGAHEHCQPNQAFVDVKTLTHFGRDAGMRGRRRMADEVFGVAQTDGGLHQLQRVDDAECRFAATCSTSLATSNPA